MPWKTSSVLFTKLSHYNCIVTAFQIHLGLAGENHCRRSGRNLCNQFTIARCERVLGNSMCSVQSGVNSLYCNPAGRLGVVDNGLLLHQRPPGAEGSAPGGGNAVTPRLTWANAVTLFGRLTAFNVAREGRIDISYVQCWLVAKF